MLATIGRTVVESDPKTAKIRIRTVIDRWLLTHNFSVCCLWTERTHYPAPTAWVGRIILTFAMCKPGLCDILLLQSIQ